MTYMHIFGYMDGEVISTIIFPFTVITHWRLAITYSIMIIFDQIYQLSQIQASPSRWHLFEWCDLAM
jgi:hypothetical protein